MCSTKDRHRDCLGYDNSCDYQDPHPDNCQFFVVGRSSFFDFFDFSFSQKSVTSPLMNTSVAASLDSTGVGRREIESCLNACDLLGHDGESESVQREIERITNTIVV